MGNMNFKFKNRHFLMLAMIAGLLVPASTMSAKIHASTQKEKQKPPCPTMKVICPDSVKQGDQMTFSAEIKGGDSNVTPTYNWTVSAGTIESGQGTASINVTTKGLEADSNITATVEAGGYDRDCGYGSTVGSCTGSVTKK
jgi:hypothetical protein